MTVEVIPVGGLPEIQAGDDLAALLLEAIAGGGPALQEGDVVVVTQKVVSKAEGRVVFEQPDGKAAWVERESRRVVARRGDLLIVETRHGFVCANGGVDASNVGEGLLSLLPEDPDASAERIRAGLMQGTATDVAVVVTDTFGRPWRYGLVNVAIGCAGMPAQVDLRGTRDAVGRVLEATIVALADEVAAASGLVMGKADGIPAAIVRGVRWDSPPGPATTLVRPAEEDLFRESPLQAILARHDARAFSERAVPEEILFEAITAAMTAPAPAGERPWIFVRPEGIEARGEWAAAAIGPEVGTLLVDAPAVVAVLVQVPAAAWPALRDALVASGGAAVENLLLALRARGLDSRWIPATALDPVGAHLAAGVGDSPVLIGAVAAGWPAPRPAPRNGRPGDGS